MNFLRSFFGGDPNTSTTAVEAKALIDEGKPLFILDVRQPEEFRSGHITGAKLIPLGELGKRIKELPTDKDILCVCASGSRSGVATQQLLKAGYKAINMRGGMGSWYRAGYAIKKGK